MMDGDEAFGSPPGPDRLPSPNSSHPASPYLSLPPFPHPAQAPMSTTTLDKPRILIGSLHSPADLVEGYFSKSGREGDLGLVYTSEVPHLNCDIIKTMLQTRGEQRWPVPEPTRSEIPIVS